MSNLETRSLNEGVIQGNPVSVSEVICNCVAFVAATLVVIGELFSEHNLWGVITIGGALSTVNILLTSVGLERARQVRGIDIGEDGESVRGMQPSRDVVVQFKNNVIERIIERRGDGEDENDEVGERERAKEEEKRKRMKKRRGEREKRRRCRKEEGKTKRSLRTRDKVDIRERKEYRVRKKRIEGLPAPENRGLYTVLNI